MTPNRKVEGTRAEAARALHCERMKQPLRTGILGQVGNGMRRVQTLVQGPGR